MESNIIKINYSKLSHENGITINATDMVFNNNKLEISGTEALEIYNQLRVGHSVKLKIQ